MSEETKTEKTEVERLRTGIEGVIEGLEVNPPSELLIKTTVVMLRGLLRQPDKVRDA